MVILAVACAVVSAFLSKVVTAIIIVGVLFASDSYWTIVISLSESTYQSVDYWTSHLLTKPGKVGFNKRQWITGFTFILKVCP